MGARSHGHGKICGSIKMSRGNRQNALRLAKRPATKTPTQIMRGEKSQLRERTLLPAFHSFGSETGFAFTFQPSLYQFALTARSKGSFCARNHPCHCPPNHGRTVSYSGHRSPPVSRTNSNVFLRIEIHTLAQALPDATLAKIIRRP